MAKEGVAELVPEIEAWLEERCRKVTTVTDVAEFLQDPAQVDQGLDLVVVLGGDGTLLGAVRAFADDPVPMVGINFGRIGFLASTPVSQWKGTLEAVFAGQNPSLLERRMRLEAEWERKGKTQRAIALNEVVLQRSSHQGMLTVSLFVGEDWVTDYRADGLILATPSGSTGYSLSAGGPILAPFLSALVVSPICSQGLSNRPIVLHPDREVALQVIDSKGVTTLAVDGHEYHAIAQGARILVRRHPEPYPLYAMPGLDPYRRLRSRLGWSGSPSPSSDT